MKKKSGVKRAVDQVTTDELQKLHTGTLLARLQRLRWCEDTADLSHLSESEIASVGDKILFKEQPKWQRAYKELKAILDEREHLKSKPR